MTNDESLLFHINEIDEFAQYPDNWDGEGAEKIQLKAIEYAKVILTETKSFISKLDDIYATPVGSLCIQWKNRSTFVNAELSDNGIAFYNDNQNDRNITDYIKSIDINSEIINKLIKCLS